LILNPDYKSNLDENYYIIVSDADRILEEHPFITIPNRSDITSLSDEQDAVEWGEQVPAPNEKFYYVVIIQDVSYPDPSKLIEIHRISDDQKVAEFGIRDPNFFDIGGWAADSRGVYFGVVSGGMLNDPRRSIRILQVPD
jgi:hypothetical protein